MQDEREELINRIRETNRHFYHGYLQSGGDHLWAEIDLTMPQLKVLFTVAASNGITMTQLSRTVGMTLSTATGVADRLIAQGLVRREDDPDDRRLVLLRASEAGINLMDRLIQVGREYFQLVASRMSVEELSLLAQVLAVLQRAMLETSGEANA